MSLAHSPNNDNRKNDLLAEVREFGRLSAQGKDALPMLALKIAYAAADNVITLDKDADGLDDTAKIYAEYVKAESKKSVHEHSAGGMKANASKLRQIVTASTMPTCAFYNSINMAISKRTDMKDVKDGPKIRPLYHTIVEMARTQIAQPDDLSEAQIEEAIRKPDPKDKDVEGELKRAEKILADLISGEKGIKCADQEIVDAHALVAGKLAAWVHTRNVAETIARANALGIGLAPAAPVEAEDEVTPQGNDEQIAA